MKLMFISDIHGSLYYLEKALLRYEKEMPDQLIILGDLLYHGPRNPLPMNYNPVEVLNKLNAIKDKIICVRGNCDGEVDQMVLEFPILAEYSIVLFEGKKIFATHGHKYNGDNLPPLANGDIIIHGHTHIPVAEKVDNIYILNPGSISLPKQNTPNTYGVLESNNFILKDLEGNTYKSIKL